MLTLNFELFLLLDKPKCLKNQLDMLFHSIYILHNLLP